MRLSFNCANEAVRPLIGDWQIAVQNSTGDRYRQFSCQGQMAQRADKTQITLTINHVPLEIGTVDRSIPLTCNWSLFDIIPLMSKELKQTKKSTSMTLLEDLEKIRQQTKLGFLEDWTLALNEVNGRTLQLSGYFLYGQGLVPSYWWLDQQNRVVIVTSIFQTWVLRG